MSTTRCKPATCPRCGYKFDRATGLGHTHRPKPGDFTLCLRCGQALRFDEDLEAVFALERELEELEADQRALIARARAALPKIWNTP